MINAKIAETLEATVIICAVMPTELSKVLPMSMRRRDVITPGDLVTKREMVSEGMISLLDE